MKKPVMISMCDKSGIMARPWAEAGYTCVCVDIQHSIRATIKKKHKVEYFEGGVVFTLFMVTAVAGNLRNLIWTFIGNISLFSSLASRYVLTYVVAVPKTGKRKDWQC